ncbi:MAG: efflux RND transporter periplasmic adaptor subunit [Arenicellales bacterium]
MDRHTLALRTPRLAVLAVCLVALVAVAGCGRTDIQKTAARPVVAERLAATDTARTAHYSGDVHARYETTLGFRESGKIARRLVKLGDAVASGQLLARLDPSDARLNLAAARAALAAAKSEYETAGRDHERYQRLLDKKVVSRSAFEHQRDIYAAAKARYEQAQRQLDLRNNQLGYTELRAEHSGVITAVSAEAGQVVSAGEPVLSLAWSDGREVHINVPEDRIGEFERAGTFRIELWGSGGTTYRGHLRELSAAADPDTRTFLAKVAIDDPGPRVRLGMTAGVTVTDSIDPKEIIVPMTALYHSGTKPAVWVVDSRTSKVKLQPVEVGRYTDGGAIIDAGLSPGAIVVTKGANELHAGEPVNPILTRAGSGDGA